MNAPGMGFELQDVMQFMDFRVFESALGNYDVISSAFWTPYFRNKFIPYNMHYHFLSISISFLKFLSRSARNKENKNGTRMGFKLYYVIQFMNFRVFESALGSQGVISYPFWTL